ncbi:MAG TPA: hypothetical protein VHW23_40140 [Kofleriaceae bacterium]|nr:hypothetical protein [Kofleriaceae bacterium]
MNIKAFFVAALSSALDLGIATPDDVLRHVTPDVLSAHLPRPLWARLLTACVGAPRVDAQLVVETIGVPNLCEHVPAPIIWACLEELGLRALGGVVVAAPGPAASSRPNGAAAAPPSRPIPLPTPPPPETRPTPPPMPAVVGPSIPLPGAGEGDGDGRTRVAPSQRFRQSNTGIGRLAANNTRRPQAQAAPTPPPPAEPAAERGGAQRVKRGQTESDYVDSETFVGGKDDWKNALAVEDEQLVDWSAADETVINGDELGRKR